MKMFQISHEVRTAVMGDFDSIFTDIDPTNVFTEKLSGRLDGSRVTHSRQVDHWLISN